jgi:hypothetical protein
MSGFWQIGKTDRSTEMTAPRALVSRAEARLHGLKTYFTGTPCKRGHVVERNTGDKHCVACRRESARTDAAKAYAVRYRASNTEKEKARKARHYAKNADAISSRSARYYIENTDAIKARKARYRVDAAAAIKTHAARYYIENTDAINERNSQYHAANPDRGRARVAKRRALKMAQRCDCCTDEDIRAAFYTRTDTGFEVDHVVPLAIGGLHCRYNLQLLAVEVHRDKTTFDAALIARVRRSAVPRRATEYGPALLTLTGAAAERAANLYSARLRQQAALVSGSDPR